MTSFDDIKKRIAANDFYWSKHAALDKCDLYGFDENIVEQEIAHKGELIECFMRHGYGCRYLVYVNSERYGTYHVAIVEEYKKCTVKITTVYKPDDRFKDDKKTRWESGGLY